MLLRSAILLYFISFLPICPSQFCDRIGTVSSEESTQAGGSQSTSTSISTERQLKNTHLRIHNIPPRALNASEGDSVWLECMAGGTPAPTIHWLKDGIIKQGATPDVYHQHLSSTNDVGFTKSRLYLDCLSVEDRGEYTCVAENPYHRLNASTNLTVMASDEEIECGKLSHAEAPRINLWTKTMISTQGNETKLICRANGDPTPTIRWLGFKEEANADLNKYEVLPNGDLIVRNLSWSDMGGYTCIAENVHGESEVEVFLYPSPMKDMTSLNQLALQNQSGMGEPSQANTSQSPRTSKSAKRQLRPRRLQLYTIPPEALNASEGNSKYLECMAEGKPEPTIYWLKDGIRITQGQTSDEYHQNISSTADPMSTAWSDMFNLIRSVLYLDCLSVEDQGEYTCVAENSYSRISASTNLIVLSSDEEIQCQKSHGEAPRINLWTKRKFALQGHDTKFICRAYGDPTPTVRWLRSEKELENADSDKYEVLPSGDLIVRDLSWSDMGGYTCIAENIHGESKVEVFLYPTLEDL